MTISAPADANLLLHAYLDGELDPAHALEVERQLARDPVLAGERARVEALQRLIRERPLREPAPKGLTRRVEATIGIRPAARWASNHPSWRALAASVVLAAESASRRACSFAVSNEVRRTLPLTPFRLARTLSVVILRMSKKSTACPPSMLSATCFMNSSLMPTSDSAPR